MLNKIILIGRLTADPQEMTKKDGSSFFKFSIAFNQGKESTGFVDCVASEHLNTAIGENLYKGDKIAITGRFAVEKYTSQKTNQTISKPVIYVDDIEFVNLNRAFEADEEELPFDGGEPVKTEPAKPEPVKAEPASQNKRPSSTLRRR